MFIRSAAIQFEKRYGGAVLNCDDYEQEGRIARRFAMPHGFAIGLVSMANRAHWQQRRGTTD